MITTIYGDREESLFERREGVVDDDNEHTTWVEYWDGSTLVHRSVHVTLKRMPEGANLFQGVICG